VGTPLTDFLISISGFEIGLLLFFLNRKRKFTKFAESMTILLQMMAPAALTIPLLVQYKGGIYFFLPIYLVAIIGWLFFIRSIVIGKIDWQIETDVKKVIRKLWVGLAVGFIALLILLCTMVPLNPNL
jgi:hypothetical protein